MPAIHLARPLLILAALSASGCFFETVSPEPVLSEVEVTPRSVAAPGTAKFSFKVAGRPNLSFAWGLAHQLAKTEQPGILQADETKLAGIPFDINATSTATWRPRENDGTIAPGPVVIDVRVSSSGGAFPRMTHLLFKFTVDEDGATTYDGYEESVAGPRRSPAPTASAQP